MHFRSDTLGIFEVKSSHQGEWGFCLWADFEDAPYDFRDHLKVGDGSIRNQSNPARAYFEKDKASGDGHFVKNCPFWKKNRTFSWFEPKVAKTTSN